MQKKSRFLSKHGGQRINEKAQSVCETVLKWLSYRYGFIQHRLLYSDDRWHEKHMARIKKNDNLPKNKDIIVIQLQV